ncbi:MAG: hydroxymethylbilane synthase [Hyphomicrobiaceae bacterium]|nr:hydroxymethylbilane synthase [Hyphomicrobiaceae bacterium]
MQADRIRIGSRGSPLALAQAHEVARRLAAAHGIDGAAIEVRTFKTSGDRIQDRPLAEAGGKGLFTKEIEEALIAGEIELAVHSMKDMPTALPDGLVMAAMLPREDVRDAFISLRYGSIADLPPGAVVGSSSLRRQAQVRRLRPDLQVAEFRGNVDTRLRKLEQGVADATFLACAGLNRLGQSDRITAVMATEDMLPAVAQGAIGVEVRSADQDTARLVSALDHAETTVCVATERAFLARLEGSCRTPIAGLAELRDGTVHFRGMILSPDGSRSHETRRQGSPADAGAMGDDAGCELRARAGPDFFQWTG